MSSKTCSDTSTDCSPPTGQTSSPSSTSPPRSSSRSTSPPTQTASSAEDSPTPTQYSSGNPQWHMKRGSIASLSPHHPAPPKRHSPPANSCAPLALANQS